MCSRRSAKYPLPSSLEKRAGWRNQRSRARNSFHAVPLAFWSRVCRSQAHGRKRFAYSRYQVVGAQKWRIWNLALLSFLLFTSARPVRMGARGTVHFQRSDLQLAVPNLCRASIRFGRRCAGTSVALRDASPALGPVEPTSRTLVPLCFFFSG